MYRPKFDKLPLGRDPLYISIRESPGPWVSASVNSRRDILMRDYLAIPSLYYDSTDKLFVVPEGRTKDRVVFHTGGITAR